MAIQELKVWAKTLKTDTETNFQQRRDITDEEYMDGLGKLTSFSAQQFNQMMFMLSSYAAPHWSCPHLVLATVTGPDIYHMTNQTLTAANEPELFALYGSTLTTPDIAAPTGYVYAVRKQ